MKPLRSILILGTRGVPAGHGGFETFAEHLALFLAARGWAVVVYCQNEVPRVTVRVRREQWRGIERRVVSVTSRGPLAALEFDYHCVVDAARHGGLCLVLGYNGAAFLPWLRLRGRKILINMDGIEWRRPKWGLPARGWFWLNEWIGAWVSNRLVADHPVIAAHLATRRPRSAIATIPYGGTPITEAPQAPVLAMGLTPDRYFVSIARVEPDNNILTLIEAFSRRPRGAMLVVLGRLDDANPYHRRVRAVAAANPEVILPGAIYEPSVVAALRFHARAYLHGHMVGGTNPSLVEALWAGNAVIAHDNPYNRWTAGDAGFYFDGADACERMIERALCDGPAVASARAAARARAAATFGWEDVLMAYEREALSLLTGREAPFANPELRQT
jgi:glycosyltransferase involved in cell wall biosynthesis